MSEQTTLTTLRLGRQVMVGDSVRIPDSNGVCTGFRAPFTGWDSPGDVQLSVVNFKGRRGAFVESVEEGPRTITVPGNIIAPTDIALKNKIEQFVADIPVGYDAPLVLSEHGTKRHIMVRHAGGQTQMFDRKGKALGSGLISAFELQLLALDPIKLSGDGSDFDVKLDTPTPGQPGQIVYVNEGEGPHAPTRVRLTDCTAPVIILDNGQAMEFPGLIIGADEELVIDFRDASVMLNGVNAILNKSGRWLPLDKHPKGYTLSYVAESYGPTARMFLDTYHSFA